MAGTRITAVIPRAIPITEVAITTAVIHTDTLLSIRLQ